MNEAEGELTFNPAYIPAETGGRSCAGAADETTHARIAAQRNSFIRNEKSVMRTSAIAGSGKPKIRTSLPLLKNDKAGVCIVRRKCGKKKPDA
jgi:hypothetical protein